jgi:hypothetical protein
MSLVDEFEKVGEQVNTKEEFDDQMMSIWDNLVDKYIMKQPFYIYSYKSYLQKKDNIESISIQINAKLDQEKYNEHKEQLEREFAEKERVLQNRYNDNKQYDKR